MSAKPQKILLTGGAGFVGSHAAEALLAGGAELSIVDNFDPFYDPAVKRANLAEVRARGDFALNEVDICDRDRLRDVFAATKPQVVIHLAARAGVRPSIADPLGYERTNVAGTLHILELCREFKAERLVFGSSSSVYGATSHAPFSEEQTDLRPISPYAATKLAAELLCYTYSHLYALPIVCLRFFTVYGPRQRPDLAIYKFTASIEAGKPLPVYGDGSAGRDYTYVDDIVAGILAAIRVPLAVESAPFRVFNLGNSHPVTLSEMIALLERATGRTAIREALPPQPGDVPLTWADISRAKRELGYRPATPIEEGLKRFVAWYRTACGTPQPSG